MDKIIKYRNIVKKEMERHAAIEQTDQPGLKSELMASKNNSKFLLSVRGWHNNKYYHHTIFNIEIKNGKVLILEDNTDFIIADKLEKLGILPEDIKCVYQEPPVQKEMKAAA